MGKISWLQALIMGLVQGLTEFLPVSSSGHLVLAKFLFHVNIGENSAFFEILLHVGTLIAICIFYYKDVLGLILEFFKLIRDIFRYFKNKEKIEIYPERKMLLLVVIASIPTAIIGLIIQKTIEDLFMSSVIAVGVALLITATILILSSRIPVGHKKVRSITYKDAAFIGIVQGIAVTPGISRSGSTITAGQAAGLDREFAIKFSFLISLPAIAGAGLLSLTEISSADIAMNGGAYLLAMVVAAVVGYICIRWMLNLLKNNKFHYFGYYCAVVGLVSIIVGLI